MELIHRQQAVFLRVPCRSALQKAQYGPSTAGNYLAYLIDPTGARMDFGYGKDNNLGNLNANGRSIYFTMRIWKTTERFSLTMT